MGGFLRSSRAAKLKSCNKPPILFSHSYLSAIIEIDLLADDVGPAAESLLPVSIADHSHRTRRGVVVRVGNHATQERSHAEDLVVVSRHCLSIAEIRQSVGIDVQTDRAK